jgi:hypothetical protein
MKKLVKEALDEYSADKKVREFYQKHHAMIYRAWKEKMQKVFKDYLPWNDSNDEETIEDCRNLWWMKVVEPGWEPAIVEKGLADAYDSNEIGNIDEKIMAEVCQELGIDYEEIIVL